MTTVMSEVDMSLAKRGSSMAAKRKNERMCLHAMMPRSMASDFKASEACTMRCRFLHPLYSRMM